MKRALIWLVVIGAVLFGAAHYHLKATLARVLDEDETFTRRPIRVEMDEPRRNTAYVSDLCVKANEGRAALREELKRTQPWIKSSLRDLTLQLMDSEEKLCTIKGEMYDSFVNSARVQDREGPVSLDEIVAAHAKTIKLSKDYRQLYPETAALEAKVVAAGGVRREILAQAQEHNLAQAGRIEGWQRQGLQQVQERLPPGVNIDMPPP